MRSERGDDARPRDEAGGHAHGAGAEERAGVRPIRPLRLNFDPEAGPLPSAAAREDAEEAAALAALEAERAQRRAAERQARIDAPTRIRRVHVRYELPQDDTSDDPSREQLSAPGSEPPTPVVSAEPAAPITRAERDASEPVLELGDEIAAPSRSPSPEPTTPTAPTAPQDELAAAVELPERDDADDAADSHDITDDADAQAAPPEEDDAPAPGADDHLANLDHYGGDWLTRLRLAAEEAAQREAEAEAKAAEEARIAAEQEAARRAAEEAARREAEEAARREEEARLAAEREELARLEAEAAAQREAEARAREEAERRREPELPGLGLDFGEEIARSHGRRLVGDTEPLPVLDAPEGDADTQRPDVEVEAVHSEQLPPHDAPTDLVDEETQVEQTGASPLHLPGARDDAFELAADIAHDDEPPQAERVEDIEAHEQPADHVEAPPTRPAVDEPAAREPSPEPDPVPEEAPPRRSRRELPRSPVRRTRSARQSGAPAGIRSPGPVSEPDLQARAPEPAEPEEAPVDERDEDLRLRRTRLPAPRISRRPELIPVPEAERSRQRTTPDPVLSADFYDRSPNDVPDFLRDPSLRPGEGRESLSDQWRRQVARRARADEARRDREDAQSAPERRVSPKRRVNPPVARVLGGGRRVDLLAQTEIRSEPASDRILSRRSRPSKGERDGELRSVPVQPHYDPIRFESLFATYDEASASSKQAPLPQAAREARERQARLAADIAQLEELARAREAAAAKRTQRVTRATPPVSIALSTSAEPPPLSPPAPAPTPAEPAEPTPDEATTSAAAEATPAAETPVPVDATTDEPRDTQPSDRPEADADAAPSVDDATRDAEEVTEEQADESMPDSAEDSEAAAAEEDGQKASRDTRSYALPIQGLPDWPSIPVGWTDQAEDSQRGIPDEVLTPAVREQITASLDREALEAALEDVEDAAQDAEESDAEAIATGGADRTADEAVARVDDAVDEDVEDDDRPAARGTQTTPVLSATSGEPVPLGELREVIDVIDHEQEEDDWADYVPPQGAFARFYRRATSPWGHYGGFALLIHAFILIGLQLFWWRQFSGLSLTGLLGSHGWAFVSVIVQLLAIFLPITLAMSLFHVPGALIGTQNSGGGRAMLRATLLGIPAALTLSGLASLMNQGYALLGVEPLPPIFPQPPTATDPASIALQIGLVAILPAIGEEFLFRGLLQSDLRRRDHAGLAIVLQALAFVLYRGDPLNWIGPLLLALLLGWLRHQSNSLFPAIGCHIVINLSLLLGRGPLLELLNSLLVRMDLAAVGTPLAQSILITLSGVILCLPLILSLRTQFALYRLPFEDEERRIIAALPPERRQYFLDEAHEEQLEKRRERQRREGDQRRIELPWPGLLFMLAFLILLLIALAPSLLI